VSCEYGLFDPELIKHEDEVVTEIFNVDDPLFAGFFAVSMAPVMRPYELKMLMEIVDDVRPDEAITGEAVAKNDRLPRADRTPPEWGAVNFGSYKA